MADADFDLRAPYEAIDEQRWLDRPAADSTRMVPATFRANHLSS